MTQSGATLRYAETESSPTSTVCIWRPLARRAGLQRRPGGPAPPGPKVTGTAARDGRKATEVRDRIPRTALRRALRLGGGRRRCWAHSHFGNEEARGDVHDD